MPTSKIRVIRRRLSVANGENSHDHEEEQVELSGDFHERFTDLASKVLAQPLDTKSAGKTGLRGWFRRIWFFIADLFIG